MLHFRMASNGVPPTWYPSSHPNVPVPSPQHNAEQNHTNVPNPQEQPAAPQNNVNVAGMLSNVVLLLNYKFLEVVHCEVIIWE